MDDIRFLTEVSENADDDTREFLQELILEMMEGY